MFPREKVPLNPPLSDPFQQSQQNQCLPFIKRSSRLLSRKRSTLCQPIHRIFEYDFFEYQTEEDLFEEMFHERCRDWEARITRDSMEMQRINSQNATLVSKRSQSTPERTLNSNNIVQLNPVERRMLGDREERSRRKLYTSSAFDATGANKTRNGKPRPSESHPCSPTSPISPTSPTSPKDPPAPLERPSRWRKMNLTIDIPEPKLPNQVIFHGRLPRDDCGSTEAGKTDNHQHEDRTSIYSNSRNKKGASLTAASAQRPMTRVMSNFEGSLRPSLDTSSDAVFERNTTNIKTQNTASIDVEDSNTALKSMKRQSGNLLAHTKENQMDRSRFVDGQRNICSSPDRGAFLGSASRSDLRAVRSSSKIHNESSPVAISLRFDKAEEHEEELEVVSVEDALQNCPQGAVRDIGRSHEASDFSRLSADSWKSVQSEQELTEREARLLNSCSSSDHQNMTESSGTFSTHRTADHEPQAIFGVDCHGDLLERMSNDNPYCLSVLECCVLLQTGADISKKLTFSRCEQRRVWMSSDFLYLNWSSRKSATKEDQIELARITRMKLADKSLVIDMTCGYSICFVFPSVTTAGLWVRALSCLVPLQANIKVPLGVTIPTETEREEFTLAEDTFANKHVREYVSVNNYVVLCNPICVPPNMGLKMAFSTSDNRFYGFRYIPRKATRHMLRTRKEIAILKTLKHKHIVQYHEVLEDPERGGMYVVYEHLSRGCIADSSNLHRMPIFKEAQVRVVMVDIINALLYLHARRISHGDIRPENILICANGEARLNPIGCIMHDFSSISNRIAHVRCRLGTSSHAFLAPEQCWLTRAPTVGRESTAVDIWGVAVLMFTLLYGKAPFHGSNNNTLQENICWGTLRFPLDPHVSKEAKSLMFQILSNKDPRTRMKLVEVRDHPWFHEFSILSPTSTRLRFPDYFESGINDSSLTDFSEDDLSGAVQKAKLHITAKKRGARKDRR